MSAACSCTLRFLTAALNVILATKSQNKIRRRALLLPSFFCPPVSGVPAFSGVCRRAKKYWLLSLVRCFRSCAQINQFSVAMMTTPHFTHRARNEFLIANRATSLALRMRTDQWSRDLMWPFDNPFHKSLDFVLTVTYREDLSNIDLSRVTYNVT